MDAMQLAARSLRAGFPLIGAFELVSQEVDPPLGATFARICQAQSMGESLADALRQAAQDNPSPDLKLFVTSVLIHLRTGGNLADMMDRLAEVIRDRIRLSRRVRVLTAQTQFSKRVLAALPLIMFVVLNLINPRYVEPLYATGVGRMLLLITVILLLLGIFVMNRVAKIRV